MRQVPPPLRELTSLLELEVGAGLADIPPGPYLERLQLLSVHKSHDVRSRWGTVPAALSGATALHTLRLPLSCYLSVGSVDVLAGIPSLRRIHITSGQFGAWVSQLHALRPDVKFHSTEHGRLFRFA